MLGFSILDYSNSDECEKYVSLIKEYYADPMGSGKDDCSINGKDLVEGLKGTSASIVFLVKKNSEIVGMATCFRMFSTFRVKPTINIHDIFVSNSCRGFGFGQALLNEIARYGNEIGCCKITLEVREDNEYAKRVYKKMGYSEESVNMLFWVKYL